MTTTSPEKVPSFFEALGIANIDVHDFHAVWLDNAYTDEIRFPYGYTRDGDEILAELAYLNLYDQNRSGDGPHGVVQGRTGSGKSHFLRSLILGLVSRYGPDKVALILADFKGGATFRGMEAIPHTVANLRELDGSPERVQKLVSLLQGEVERRMQFISGDRQQPDIFTYRSEQRKHAGDPGWPSLPNLIVVIDEFGDFLKNNPQYMGQLMSIARIGRSLGVNLLLASQFLDRTVLGDLLDQTAFRFSLAVPSEAHSRALLDSDVAAKITVGEGRLRGKIFRKFPEDTSPVEVVAFPIAASFAPRCSACDGDESIEDRLLKVLSDHDGLRVVDRWEI